MSDFQPPSGHLVPYAEAQRAEQDRKERGRLADVERLERHSKERSEFLTLLAAAHNGKMALHKLWAKGNYDLKRTRKIANAMTRMGLVVRTEVRGTVMYRMTNEGWAEYDRMRRAGGLPQVTK